MYVVSINLEKENKEILLINKINVFLKDQIVIMI